MAARMTFVTKLRTIFQNLEAVVNKLYGPHPGMFGAPALCYDTAPTPQRHSGCSPDSALAQLLEPIMYAVQRNRRTLEKRKTRKMTEFYFKHAIPKTNIVNCLNCGHPHEKETICGNCYEKVKAEVEEMRKAMGEDKYYYDYPRTEVVYQYKNDDTTIEYEESEEKRPYVVKVDKNRPEWFPRELVTKKT